MSDIKLSIVIPAFNVQKYICSCLASLVEQSKTDEIEIVIVNDGSTDNTKEIILSNFNDAIESSLIRLINQENQGVSVARNVGVDNARGLYVAFVDADDFLMPNYVSKILDTIRNDEFDIVEFGFKKFISSSDELNNAVAEYSNDCFGVGKTSKKMDRLYAIARWYPWTRVFKKNLFAYKKFPTGVRFCEDMMTVPYLYENAQTVCVLKDVLYGYRVNLEGATLNVKPDYYENLIQFYSQTQSNKAFRFDLLRFSVAFSLYSCSVKTGKHIPVPGWLWADVAKMKFNPKIYLYLDFRKILILCYPSTYRCLKSLTG